MLRGREVVLYLGLAAWVQYAYANNPSTMAQGLLGYDWNGLLIVAIAGIFGGCGQTLYALGARKVLVADLPFAILRDAILGVGSTFLVFVLCVANNSLASTDSALFGWRFFIVPRDVVVLFIFLAGISSGKTLFFARDFLTDLSLWIRRRVFRRDSPLPLSETVSHDLK